MYRHEEASGLMRSGVTLPQRNIVRIRLSITTADGVYARHVQLQSAYRHRERCGNQRIRASTILPHAQAARADGLGSCLSEGRATHAQCCHLLVQSRTRVLLQQVCQLCGSCADRELLREPRHD